MKPGEMNRSSDDDEKKKKNRGSCLEIETEASEIVNLANSHFVCSYVDEICIYYTSTVVRRSYDHPFVRFAPRPLTDGRRRAAGVRNDVFFRRQLVE